MPLKLWSSSWELQTEGGLLNVLSGYSGRDLNLEVHPGVSFWTLKVGLSVWRSYSEISITWQWKADPVS